MSVAFETETSFYDDCFSHTEGISLRILKSSTNHDDLVVKPFNFDEDFTYDHWVCSITVALGEAKVYIKAHFASRTAREVAAKGLCVEDEGLSTSVLIDFMREYLNRVMGDIKSRYQSDEVEVSVPQITPAYDKGVSTEGDLDLNVRYWKICWNGGQIVLGCYIIPTGDVTAISAKDEDDEDEEDNIDFL